MLFWIGWLVYALLWLAALELNKNMMIGWALAIGLFILYALLLRKWIPAARWYTRLGAFFALTLLLVAVFKFTVGPVKLRPAVEGKDPAVTEVVNVEQGQLTGLVTQDGMVEVYAGIPYAAPPVGELRWREPQEPAAWEGVFAADHFAPMSMQVVNSNLYSSIAQIIGYHDYETSLHDHFRDAVSEDSLYLNIWKPAGEQHDLPVLVFIHGGSLQTGQPWYADYSGEGLARKDVIVVNFGYRLGVFGFFADEALIAESPNGTAGNYGLLDQIQALRWVQKNIAAFGGDPANVTLAGESAGAACVTALCCSPLAEGLFVRAVAESSTLNAPQPAHSYRTMEEALETGKATRERFGASSLADMRAIPAEKLAAAMDTNHHVTVDGYVLPQSPYEAGAAGVQHAQAVLHGYNAEEGAPFLLFGMASLKNYEQKVRALYRDCADEVLALYPAASDAEARENWIELYSAYFFSYGHYCWGRQLAAMGIPVYEYCFSKSNGRLGAWHSGEMVYCYGNIPANSKLYDTSDHALSETFCSYLANFARTGDPNGEGLPVWEKTGDGAELLNLGDTVSMTRERYLELYAILDGAQGFLK